MYKGCSFLDHGASSFCNKLAHNLVPNWLCTVVMARALQIDRFVHKCQVFSVRKDRGLPLQIDPGHGKRAWPLQYLLILYKSRLWLLRLTGCWLTRLHLLNLTHGNRLLTTWLLGRHVNLEASVEMQVYVMISSPEPIANSRTSSEYEKSSLYAGSYFTYSTLLVILKA